MPICFIKFDSIAKTNLNQSTLSKLHNFIGTASRLKSWIKSLTVMLSFINWKVKKFSFLHYPLDLFLLIDLQTAIPSLQIKECNMHHTSRKDDEGELTCFWIFSLLLSTFLIISDTTHTEEVRPKRNSRSARESKLGFMILSKILLGSLTLIFF